MKQAKDTIQRFLFEHFPVRGEMVRLNESFKTIMGQHQYPVLIKKLLGETLAASVLLTSTIKFEGQLTIQLQSKGPIKLLVAKCDHRCHIRGLAQWDAEAVKDEAQIENAFGAGNLVITLQRDDVVKPYQSIVPLNHRTVAEAIEFYFMQSEQLNTRLWIRITDSEALGILLQTLPTDRPEDKEHFWRFAQRLDAAFSPRIFDQENEDLVKNIFPDEDIRLFQAHAVTFHCNCSLLRMEDALKTLGEAEAMHIIKRKQQVVVTCEYCNNHYAFDRHHVERIFKK